MPHPETWLKVLPDGLFCEPGGFYIDPLRPVARAIITHAHADHARPGHDAVLASPETLALMDVRMGEGRAGAVQQALNYGEAVTIGEVRVWMQPAGHVLGSAQVAMEWRGSRAVVSGDYKRQADPTCLPFIPIPCDVFVTEATFALPVFRHPPAKHEIAKLLDSVALFSRAYPRRWRLCARQGAAGDRIAARSRVGPADLPAWRANSALRRLWPPRDSAGRAFACHSRGKRQAEGGDRHRTPQRHRRPLGTTSRRARRLQCVRLDAGPAARPQQRGSSCRWSSRTTATGTS